MNLAGKTCRTFDSAIAADAWAAAVDAALGYPKLTGTLHHSVVVKHPTLDRWAYAPYRNADGDSESPLTVAAAARAFGSLPPAELLDASWAPPEPPPRGG